MTTWKSDGEPVHERPEFRSMAELCCWTVVVLAPLLTWVNGGAVSTDQIVVRTVVFSAALCGGMGLRIAGIVRWMRNRSGPRTP